MIELGHITVVDIALVAITIICNGGMVFWVNKKVTSSRNTLKGNTAAGDIAGGDIKK